MPRLGELLIAAGELTATEIEQALRAQVMWGGRIGTNLIELGYIDLDKLAVALGKQHRMPAALARHFDKSERAVQSRLNADIAERYSCVPLLYAGPNKTQLIIATIAPLDKRTIAIIADDMRIDPALIVQSVAGELRIRYQLERVYNIKRGTRFLRAKGKTIPPFPQLDIDGDSMTFEDSAVDHKPIALPVPQLVVVDESSSETDLAIEEARGELRARLDNKAAEKEKAQAQSDTAEYTPFFEPDEIKELEEVAMLEQDVIAIPEQVEQETSTGRERRTYLRMIDAEAPEALSETGSGREASLGRISIKRLQVSATAVDEAPATMGLTLGEATRAIRRSQDRERVAELVGEVLFRFMMSCEAAQMLVIRGDAAISWKGFSRSGAVVPEIAVPLDQPGLIPRVIERCKTLRMPSSDLGPIDQLLLVSLGAQSGDLVIVPVSIAGQVMCVIALAAQHDSTTATAESVAAAAGAAFARLMRNASR